VAPRLEGVVRDGLTKATATSLKSTYFTTYRALVRTPEGVQWLERLWANRDSVPSLTFAESDYIAMATELSLREAPTWAAILEEQLKRIENPDRRARFAFAMPALSADPAVRDQFFASLADPANRRREPWVVDGLAALHHPLRARHAQKYLRPSLDLLREIQRTGDIFFPKRWLDATLGGHNSEVAAQEVRDFLNEHADYPARLRQIILQSADELFRASGVLSGR
jgi:aminopeptidase N